MDFFVILCAQSLIINFAVRETVLFNRFLVLLIIFIVFCLKFDKKIQIGHNSTPDLTSYFCVDKFEK